MHGGQKLDHRSTTTTLPACLLISFSISSQLAGVVVNFGPEQPKIVASNNSGISLYEGVSIMMCLNLSLIAELILRFL